MNKDIITVEDLINYLQTQPKNAVICRYSDGFKSIQPITKLEKSCYYHPDNVDINYLEDSSELYLLID